MTSTEVTIYTETPNEVVEQPVEPDVVLIGLWLHGLPATTQREYRREIRDLLDYTGKPLAAISLLDLQA